MVYCRPPAVFCQIAQSERIASGLPSVGHTARFALDHANLQFSSYDLTQINPSRLELAGARRPSQNRRNVLDQLDTPIEGPAADHLECNIGIAIVDAVPTAGAGDDGKHDHAEAVHEAGFQQ